MTEREWLDGNQLSLDIWNNKYRCGDETFEEWLDRISGGNKEVRQLIKDKKFIFGGRILANRGLQRNGRKITLSNCYVIPAPKDNLESIFECATQLARTYSYGGGCGIDVSKLRPKGSKVNNAARTTSGTVSFMDFFSYVTGLIGQEGRRGALMISIDCTHPDLEEFINLKSDLNLCTKANISVRVSDEFMKAVEEDTSWTLYFETETEHISKVVQARDIFKLLAKRNWEMAEPGILYWDRIKNYNMLDTDSNFEYDGVNPCAEEPLPAGGSCLLGSLNLAEFVKNPFTATAQIDWDALEEAVAISVRALNQVLIEGMELHPLDIQRKSVYNWRQIGLGTMGLGDMLIKLRCAYGSDYSINLINAIFRTIAVTAVETSLQLAKMEGCYPMCNKKKLVSSSFIRALGLPENVLQDIEEHGLFNSQLLTCAPTGTIGTMLQVSTGVEPNYAFHYNRRTVSLNEEETTYIVDASIVKQYKEATGESLLPKYFVTSQEINPIDRIKVQAALQQWIDASISSTINLPEETTIEQVYDIYMEAWRQGLKGVTIWRDNCQRQGILSTDNKKEDKKDETKLKDWADFKKHEAVLQVEDNQLKRGEIIKTGDHWLGLKRTLMTGCGTLHVESFWDPETGELRECYLSKGSQGGCNNFMIGLSRMMSLAARGGIDVEHIIDQLNSCGTCPSYAVRSATKKDTSRGSCCPVAVGNALREMHKEIQDIICECNKPSVYVMQKTEEIDSIPHKVQLSPTDKPIKTVVPKEVSINTYTVQLEECPSCHEKTLIHQGGCIQCNSCGYSKCN